MSDRRTSVRAAALDYLSERKPILIDAAEIEKLRQFVRERTGQERGPSKERILGVLFATDVEIDSRIGGLPLDLRNRVRTRDPDSAASTLVEMSGEYAAARRADDRQRTSDCRRAVLRAKSRIRRTLGRKNLSAGKRREKEELLIWFLTWLESPELFPDWIELHLRAGSGRRGNAR